MFARGRLACLPVARALALRGQPLGRRVDGVATSKTEERLTVTNRNRVHREQPTPIRVIVSGTGKMGAVIMSALEASEDFELVGAVNRGTSGDALSVDGRKVEVGHAVSDIARWDADVVVDFSNHKWTKDLIPFALQQGVRPVIGTSGLDVDWVRSEFKKAPQLGGLIAPNFTRSGILLTYLARLVAPHFDFADIFEEHRPGKADAPSGTAKATAEAMREARREDFVRSKTELHNLEDEDSTGANFGGASIHSTRRPAGRLCRHEVVLTDGSDTLAITQDTISREAMLPLILESVRMVIREPGLIVGLEEKLGLPQPSNLATAAKGDDGTSEESCRSQVSVSASKERPRLLSSTGATRELVGVD